MNTHSAFDIFYSYQQQLSILNVVISYNWNYSSWEFLKLIKLFDKTNWFFIQNQLLTAYLFDIKLILNSQEFINFSTWANNYTKLVNNLLHVHPVLDESLDTNFINLQLLSETRYSATEGYIVLQLCNTIEHIAIYWGFIFNSLIIFYLITIGYLLISNSYIKGNRDTQDISILFSNLSVQSEKEIGAFDDLMNTFLLVLLIFSGFTAQFIFSNAFSWLTNSSLIGISILLFLSILLLNLVLLTWDIGMQFLVFIRGISRKKSFGYELVSDLIFIISYVARTFIQNIRIAVIFVFYYSYVHTLNDYSPEVITPNFSLTIISDIFSSNTIGSTRLIINLLKGFCHLIVEVGHMIIGIGAQIGSFLLIIFWIFNSLYFTYEDNKSENYYLLKRYIG